MPTAICSCGKLTHWRNQRGTRLADLRCACGQPVRRATWTPQGWIETPPPAAKPASTREACALCGRLRQVPGRGVRLTRDTVYQVRYRGEHTDVYEPRTVQAGAVVCASHEPSYPVLVDRPPAT
jgi:hypothetical protein